MKARLLVRFTVPGRAEPRGSKTVATTKDGRAFIRDDNRKSKAWMQRVAKCGALAMRARKFPPVDCPCLLVVTIYRTRPESHFNKSGLSQSSPVFPSTKPDLTKCIRGIEDGLNGVVWTDDSRVVEQRTKKRFGDREEVLIEVYVMPSTLREGGRLIADRQQRRLIEERGW